VNAKGRIRRSTSVKIGRDDVLYCNKFAVFILKVTGNSYFCSLLGVSVIFEDAHLEPTIHWTHFLQKKKKKKKKKKNAQC
ncbi:hypothetical protein X975_08174, partial [Stegodyphus mimosarum]